MTDKQRKNIEDLESLGFNVKRLDYDSLVHELIHKYVTLCDVVEYEEQDRFSKELKRLQTNTN
jgi:hypothetical protein